MRAVYQIVRYQGKLAAESYGMARGAAAPLGRTIDQIQSPELAKSPPSVSLRQNEKS